MKRIRQIIFANLFFLLCCTALQAQQAMRFDYTGEDGKSYSGSVRFLLKTQEKTVEPGGEVDFKEGALIFLYCEMGTRELTQLGTQKFYARCLPDFISLSDNNLEFVQPGDYFHFRVNRSMQIKIKGPGQAFVKIHHFNIGPKESEQMIAADPPVFLRFKINPPSNTPKTEPAETPADPETTPATQPPANTNTATRPQSAPKPAAQQPKQELPPDIQAYNEAMGKSDNERVSALQNFVEEFPNSGKVAAALKNLPLEVQTETSSGEIRKYRLKYAACLPKILIPLDQKSIKIDSANLLRQDGRDYLLQFTVTGKNPVTIEIRDSCKSAPGNQAKTLTITGNPLRVILTEKSESEFTLELSGGKPEVLEFLLDGKRFPRFIGIPRSDTTYTFQKSQVRSVTGQSGVFHLQIVEKDVVTPVDGSINVPPPEPWWPYVLGGLALILGIVAFSRYRTHLRNKALKARVEEMKANEEKAAQWIEPTPEPVSAPAPVATGAVKIKKAAPPATDPKALSEEQFEALLQTDNYQSLALKKQWSDTVLTEVHLSAKSIRGISKFLQDQRNTMEEEKEGTIPEIGGFLLGKYCLSAATNKYRVILEEFVPIVPEEHTVYQLRFSTESIVRELGDMQDTYPELSLVGWFHTHPGHGLFLSRPDLTVHNGFFKEPFQFAMEIDTLTAELDTGFFSRKSTGQVNNVESNLAKPDWFHWTDIEQQSKP